MRKIMYDPITHERKVCKRDTIIRTKFGLWMTQNMMRSWMTQMDIANKLHISRATVNGHATGYKRPTFVNVISYCWAFGCKDDPKEVWKLVDEKIES